MKHLAGMKIAGAASLAFLMTACGSLEQALTTNPFNNGYGAGQQARAFRQPEQQATDPSTFAQITDVPIPANSRLNIDRSIILGGPETWTGRAELAVPYSSAEMYDFFRREMATFGWSELTSVRADESVLTYRRGVRIATITIVGLSRGGAIVAFTVAPQGGVSYPAATAQPNFQQQPILAPSAPAAPGQTPFPPPPPPAR